MKKLLLLSIIALALACGKSNEEEDPDKYFDNRIFGEWIRYYDKTKTRASYCAFFADRTAEEAYFEKGEWGKTYKYQYFSFVEKGKRIEMVDEKGGKHYINIGFYNSSDSIKINDYIFKRRED